MGLHGRGSRPGLVLVTPFRGALFLFMGMILHQLGGNGECFFRQSLLGASQTYFESGLAALKIPQLLLGGFGFQPM